MDFQSEDEDRLLVERPDSSDFQIEFEPYILSEVCPYQVNIEKLKIAELLKTLELDANSIKKLKLRIIQQPIISPDGRSTGAVYSNNTITISSGTWWEFQERQLNVLDNLIVSQGIEDQSDESIKTRARESLVSEIQKKFDHDFIHEVAHFAGEASLYSQAANSLKRLDFKGVARFLMQRASLFSPDGVAQEEERAERVVQDIESQGKWNSFVAVSRKAPNLNS